MFLILQQPLMVNEVEPDGTLAQKSVPVGVHPIVRATDPTGKTNREWYVLCGEGKIGAPVGYFEQFAQARGASQVRISDRREG